MIADGDGTMFEVNKKIVTDADLQKKSIKLVVMHLRKKVDPTAQGISRVCEWIDDMEDLLSQESYNRADYFEMRKKLYDSIEWVMDVELRGSLRNSWTSFGKAMTKKAPRN